LFCHLVSQGLKPLGILLDVLLQRPPPAAQVRHAVQRGGLGGAIAHVLPKGLKVGKPQPPEKTCRAGLGNAGQAGQFGGAVGEGIFLVGQHHVGQLAVGHRKYVVLALDQVTQCVALCHGGEGVKFWCWSPQNGARYAPIRNIIFIKVLIETYFSYCPASVCNCNARSNTWHTSCEKGPVFNFL
jgi:hypothetical protein